MNRLIVFLLGVLAAFLLVGIMGWTPQGLVGKYQISAWGTEDGKHGVYLVDSSTGEVWEVHRLGEIDLLGRPFEDRRTRGE
jgi:hypothetical protein